MAGFRWNDWNRDHATKHGVSIEQAEHVVRNARRPYPKRGADNKWLAIGQSQSDEKDDINGRPTVGAGAKILSVSIERGLLEKADAFAKRHKLKRSQMVAHGLRLVMQRRAG